MHKTIIISVVLALAMGVAWTAGAGQVDPIQMKRLQIDKRILEKSPERTTNAPLAPVGKIELQKFLTPGQRLLESILAQDADADTIINTIDSCNDSYYQLIRLNSIPSGKQPTETIVDGVRIRFNGYTYNPPYVFVGIGFPDGVYTHPDGVELVTPESVKIINAGEIVPLAGTNKYMRYLYADNNAVDLLITDAVPIPEEWYQYQNVMQRYWQLLTLLTKGTVKAANVAIGCTIPYFAIYPPVVK